MTAQAHWNALDHATREAYVNAEIAKIRAFGGDIRKAERAATLVAFDHYQVDKAKADEADSTREAYERGFALVNGQEFPLSECPAFIVDAIKQQIAS